MKRLAQVAGAQNNTPAASQFSGRPGGTGIRLTQDSAGQAVPNQNPTADSAMDTQGSSLEELKALLTRIIQGEATTGNSAHLKSEIDVMMKGDIPESLKPELEILGNVVMMNSNPAQITPGTKDPAGKAQEIMKAIDNLSQRKDEMNVAKATNTATRGFNLARYIEAQSQHEPAEGPPAPKKKRTRGNPFRVLMGQIGKLLDHGMSKRDIVRYLNKKAVFDEETIDKAVDIVKDYNQRKEYKDQTSDQLMDQETKEDINKRLSMGFNWKRYAEKNSTAATELYGVSPQYDKRSTAELFARLSWLSSLQSFNGDSHSEGRKAADASGVSTEIKAIRSALTKRGFSTGEIESNS